MVTSGKLSLSGLFAVWLKLGIQSFGGGVATFALIRDAAINRYRWMTEEEFNEAWSIVQIVPGINLIALTMLLGRKARGPYGVVAAVAGLLVPSILITAAITAGYHRVRHVSDVRAALKGALPAIIGIGVLTSYQMAVPTLRVAKLRGNTDLLFCLALIALSGMAMLSNRLPVSVILISIGAISAVQAIIAARLSRRSLAPQSGSQ